MNEPNRRWPSVDASRRTLLALGFTVILVSYFMVWLPNKLAGLSFIGLEMGEWVKFLPQVRSGQISADRNLFYLPPITLGLMLAFWTVGWPNRRWQTWVMRLSAVLVALLAFPAIEAIVDEGRDQWLVRLIMILLVAFVAIGASFLHRLPRDMGVMLGWAAMLVSALVGMILPTWAYLAVRPAVAELLAQPVGLGPGLWLNGIGHLLISILVLTWLLEQPGRTLNHAR